MTNHLKVLVLQAIFAAFLTGEALAQRGGQDDFPFSIMKPEPGERPARARPSAIPPASAKPSSARPAKPAKQATARRYRGSSTYSTIPAYRSPLTPLGTAPTIGTVQPLGQPASPSAQVPGISTGIGTPAVTPPRPAGQSFQDRTVNCVQSGGGQGVGPGQIGAFTQNCVNR